MTAIFSTPPFLSDGFTTFSRPALKPVAPAAEADAAGAAVPLGSVLSPPPQADKAKAKAAPEATTASVLFFIYVNPLLVGAGERDETRVVQRLDLGSSASRRPSPNRLKASTVMKIAMPGKIMKCGTV
ncbi:hypothetical protein GCM10009555_010710 [Acrocarpospora macrocephala]|uniref:Uncharacterized protein n=1 Tax=Acrocarpospora macrocephala TaxID=150177 RepID=A0A5M3X4C4_9ACTN|nr:hypothetical protein Amac_085560 [Acrocarpospora macrocephala]